MIKNDKEDKKKIHDDRVNFKQKRIMRTHRWFSCTESTNITPHDDFTAWLMEWMNEWMKEGRKEGSKAIKERRKAIKEGQKEGSKEGIEKLVV